MLKRRYLCACFIQARSPNVTLVLALTPVNEAMHFDGYGRGSTQLVCEAVL